MNAEGPILTSSVTLGIQVHMSILRQEEENGERRRKKRGGGSSVTRILKHDIPYLYNQIYYLNNSWKFLEKVLCPLIILLNFSG